MTLSAAAHVCLASLWLSADRTMVGAGGSELATVSIEVVSVLAGIESAEPHDAPEVDVASVPPSAGFTQPELTASEAAPRTARLSETIDPPDADLPTHTIADLATPDRRPPEKALQQPDQPPSPAKAERPREEDGRGTSVANQTAQVSTMGSNLAAAPVSSTPPPRPSGASARELARFAMQVRVALGRYRPAHAGIRGRVVISFRLGSDGGLEDASVIRSSGIPKLDRDALAAVRRATFPRPPAGLTAAQRHYSVPFDFN